MFTLSPSLPMSLLFSLSRCLPLVLTGSHIDIIADCCNREVASQSREFLAASDCGLIATLILTACYLKTRYSMALLLLSGGGR